MSSARPHERARRVRWAPLLGALALSCGTGPSEPVPTVAILTLVATHHLGDGGLIADGGLLLPGRGSSAPLELRRALVTVSSVEVLPCPGSARRWWQGLGLVGSAWAHGATTPRRLGVPTVLDLTRPEGHEVALGRLLPPMGHYCQARVVFAPTDADGAAASGFPSMTGLTLELEGQLDTADGGVAVAVSSQGLQSKELDLFSTNFDGGAEVSLRFELDLAAALDGVDLSVDGGVAQALSQLAAGTTVSRTK